MARAAGAGGRGRGDEAAVLVLLPRRARGEAAAAAPRAALRADERVEALEPFVAVELREAGVGDGRGMVDQALLEAGAGFGRVERGGVDLVPPQALDERFGGGEQGFHRRAAARVDDVVGVLAGGQRDEAQGALGAEVGQGAGGGADRGLLPGAVAVEAEDRRGLEPPHPLELGLGQRGAVGGDDLADPGAVEAR